MVDCTSFHGGWSVTVVTVDGSRFRIASYILEAFRVFFRCSLIHKPEQSRTVFSRFFFLGYKLGHTSLEVTASKKLHLQLL